MSDDIFDVDLSDSMIATIDSIETREQQFDDRLTKQVVVEVTPLGESTPMPMFFTLPSGGRGARRSKWRRWLRAFKDLLPGDTEISKDTLIGKIVKFDYEVQELNIRGRSVESEFWRPVKIYADENEALRDLENPEPTAANSTTSSLPQDVIEQAKITYNTLGDEERFRQIAAITWPNYSVDDLLAAVK